MSEIWKDIINYEGYYVVSNLGRVKRIEHKDCNGHIYKERILKLSKQSNPGYLHVHLSKNGIAKWHSVHRLVAEAFVDKKEGCDIVNHLDNDPSNNKADNLEWTTHEGNMQYAAMQGRMKYRPDNLKRAQESLRKPVIAIKGEEKITFNSQAEAARILGISHSHIAAACRKEYGYNTVGGYEWEYQDKEYQKNLKPKKKKIAEDERRELQRKQMIGNKIMLGRKLAERTKEKLRKNNVKPVLQFDKNGNFIKEYFSAQEAKRITGISHIDTCCRRERKTAGGYIWRYKDE